MITLKLDELLTERSLSAYALAKKTGLHQSVISKIRRNESQALRLDVLDKLCVALECQPGDLIVSDNRITTRNVDATRNEKQLSFSDSDGLLTLTQVAERLKLSRKRVNDYVNEGKLRATKGKQGHNFVSEADLEEFIKSR
jgi:putative transcriptional regulator